MPRIEEWKMSKAEIAEALELQRQIREAGLSWPQVDMLLERPRGTVQEWCRGHARVPGQFQQQIKEILDKVKDGKLKPPVVWEEK